LKTMLRALPAELLKAARPIIVAETGITI
jgi:hypothetical protein